MEALMSANQNLFTIETILCNAVLANVNPNKEGDGSWDIKITFDPSMMPQVLKELPSLAIYDLKVSVVDDKGSPISNKAFAVTEIRVEENVMFILFSTRIVINGKTVASSKLDISIGCSVIFYIKRTIIRVMRIMPNLE
jgi:hypothetical protein